MINQQYLGCAALALLGSFLVAGCGEKEGGGDKEAFEKAISETKEKIALISVYRPYLDKPKVEKYDPEKRTDLDRMVTFAANEVRHAANGASQRLARSKSEALKPLADAFTAVAKTCAEVEGDEAAAVCKGEVAKLEKALADSSDKAKAAGATGTFSVIGEGSIDDGAKKAVADFLTALGPGEQEKKYLAMRRDESVKPDDLAAACDAAAMEAGTTMTTVKALGNEEVHKVAAHHKAAVDGQCVRMKELAALVATLDGCREKVDKKEKFDEAECKLACSKVKGRVDRGIPAAPFERLVKDQEGLCKEIEPEK